MSRFDGFYWFLDGSLSFYWSSDGFLRFQVHFCFSVWVLRRDSISAHVWSRVSLSNPKKSSGGTPLGQHAEKTRNGTKTRQDGELQDSFPAISSITGLFNQCSNLERTT